MSYNTKAPGFPLCNIDTPREKEKLKAAINRGIDMLEPVVTLTMRGKMYRVMGWRDKDDGAICGVVEYMYKNKWVRMLNYGIAKEVKDAARLVIRRDARRYLAPTGAESEEDHAE